MIRCSISPCRRLPSADVGSRDKLARSELQTRGGWPPARSARRPAHRRAVRRVSNATAGWPPVVHRLAGDLPGLWSASTTTAVDRKRLLRLVMSEVVLSVAPQHRRAEVVIVWSGGATSRHEVRCPPLGWHACTEPEVLARLRVLAEKYPDHQIAMRLNLE